MVQHVDPVSHVLINIKTEMKEVYKQGSYSLYLAL